MNKSITLLFFFFSTITYSQLKLSLDDVIKLAHGETISAKTVTNNFENNYWRYYAYKRSFLPSLSFNGTLPNLNVGIDEIPQPDGTSDFKRRSQINYLAGLELRQAIPWTGGNVFISSEVARLDVLGVNERTSFNSTPFYIGYSQAINKFNPYKWQKRIEPLNFEESKKKSIEQSEDISIEAVQLFFEVVNNVSRYDIAQINVANSDTLFKISQGRYNLGKIAESELLQIELTLLNAERTLAQSELDVVVSKQRLKTFLGLSPQEEIQLTVDDSVPEMKVDIPQAIQFAKENRSEIVSFKKNLLESERELERAKRENSFSADLFVSYGSSQTANNLEGSLANLQDQESVNMGISVPIYNWGLNKARVKQQAANSELINNQVEQSKINFEREVFIQATQFNLMNRQVEIAKKSLIVAEKRYLVSKQRFLIGKSDILTFNNSLTERNQAVNSYNQTLLQYWTFYYRIRKLTHYDFEKNEIIRFESEL
ncbi:MAG: TolC family protein [Flavobacteriales bacterium]